MCNLIFSAQAFAEFEKYSGKDLNVFGLTLGKKFDGNSVKKIIKKNESSKTKFVNYWVQPSKPNSNFTNYSLAVNKSADDLITHVRASEAPGFCNKEKLNDCKKKILEIYDELVAAYGQPVREINTIKQGGGELNAIFRFGHNESSNSNDRYQAMYRAGLAPKPSIVIWYTDRVATELSKKSPNKTVNSGAVSNLEKYKESKYIKTSIPSSNDIKNYLGYRIKSESKGQIKLIDFNKLEEFRKIYEGDEIYTVKFQSSIQFLETCRWVTGHMSEFKGFETKPVDQRSGQSGYAGYMAGFSNPGTNVDKGTKVKLRGKIVFIKSDSGWKYLTMRVDEREKFK